MFVYVRRIMLSACLCICSIYSHGQSCADTVSCNPYSCCGNGDPTPVGVMISHVHAKGQWMLSYRYMNMGMNGIVSGAKHITADDVFVNYLMAPEKMRMDMHMLMGMYGLTDKITIMAMFNYNVVSMNMTMFNTGGAAHHHGSSDNGHTHAMHSNGLGDTKLHLLYALLNKKNRQLIVSAGLSIPSGNIQVKGSVDDAMYPSQRLPYSMQMGSGTWDILPAVTYLQESGNITFSSQLNFVFHADYNAVGYQYGDEGIFNNWLAYKWLPFLTSSFRMEAIASSAILGKDKSLYAYYEPSANPSNYGGRKINAYIGSVLQFRKNCLKNHRLGMEYGIPVYQNLYGIQMPITHSVYASWSYAF